MRHSICGHEVKANQGVFTHSLCPDCQMKLAVARHHSYNAGEMRETEEKARWQ